MYVSEWTDGKGWDQGALKPYGPMQLMPSSQVSNISTFFGLSSLYRQQFIPTPLPIGVSYHLANMCGYIQGTEEIVGMRTVRL